MWRKAVLAIFEGTPAGADPEGWPLFTAGKLLAVAELEAIAPCIAKNPVKRNY